MFKQFDWKGFVLRHVNNQSLVRWNSSRPWQVHCNINMKLGQNICLKKSPCVPLPRIYFLLLWITVLYSLIQTFLHQVFRLKFTWDTPNAFFRTRAIWRELMFTDYFWYLLRKTDILRRNIQLSRQFSDTLIIPNVFRKTKNW